MESYLFGATLSWPNLSISSDSLILLLQVFVYLLIICFQNVFYLSWRMNGSDQPWRTGNYTGVYKYEGSLTNNRFYFYFVLCRLVLVYKNMINMPKAWKRPFTLLCMHYTMLYNNLILHDDLNLSSMHSLEKPPCNTR